MMLRALAIAGACWFGFNARGAQPFTTNPNGPRARVVIVQERDAVDAFRPRPEKVQAMVNRAITNLTGKADRARSLAQPGVHPGCGRH